MRSVFAPIDPNISATIAAAGNPFFTGVSYHTSAQALPIPIVWGTRRVSPNIIWQCGIPSISASDLLAWQTDYHTSTSPDYNPTNGQFGGRLNVGSLFKYGTPDHTSSDSRIFVPMIFALCEGPINDIIRAWDGGGGAAVAWADINADGGSHVLGVQYEIFMGTSSQTPWAYWAAHPGDFVGQNLAYRFTAYIATPFTDTGHDIMSPQQSFLIVDSLP